MMKPSKRKNRTAVIKECDVRDQDDRPLAEQKVCLYTEDGKDLLGRHPDEAAAAKQEAAIHARGGAAEDLPALKRYDPRGWTPEQESEFADVYGYRPRDLWTERDWELYYLQQDQQYDKLVDEVDASQLSEAAQWDLLYEDGDELALRELVDGGYLARTSEDGWHLTQKGTIAEQQVRAMHPDWPSQEEVFQAREDQRRLERQQQELMDDYYGAGVKRAQYIRLAEVPESALKSLYDQKWGQGIMKALGEDFEVDAKSAQFLFHSVWSAIIGLMDRVLQKTWKVDTTQLAQDPMFMQALAGLAYFVSDDAIKRSVGLKSDSLQKATGHVEALMAAIGKEEDVQKTLQQLARQAEPVADKAFEQLTTWLAQQEPEQKAAAAAPLTNNASVLVAFLRRRAGKLSDKQLELRRRRKKSGEDQMSDLDLDDPTDLTQTDAAGDAAAAKQTEQDLSTAAVMRTAISPKYADRLVREWTTELEPGATGHRSIWLYPVIRMDASAEEWLERAEHEGLYIPAGQRDLPGIQQHLQQELNDQLAVQLDDETEVGQVGSFVYTEQDGTWGLMYETPAVEDLLLSLSGAAPQQQRAAEREPKLLKATYQGAQYREATAEQLERLGCGADDGKGRDRDSRAPAVQLTQELGKLPGGQRERPKADQPKADGKVKKFFEWLGKKSHEASASTDSPRSRWGRLAGIEPSGGTHRQGCGCGRDRARESASAVELPTKCVSEMIGVEFSRDQTVSFEKKGDDWFVDGQDSKGVVGDDLVGALKSYCEQQQTTATTQQEVPMTQQPTKLYQHRGALYRQALEGEQQDLGPDVTDRYRGFDFSVLPALAEEALTEIRSAPEDFDNHDEGFEYYLEDLVVASGIPDHYAEALGIDTDDPEWQEAAKEGYEWEMIQEAEDDISDRMREYMERNNIPGNMYIGSNEGSGDYGIIYYIDYDEAEQNGVVIPPQEARWATASAAPVAWLITQDHIDGGRAKTRNFDQYADQATSKFRMYDDDGELYYEGVATPATEFEPLDDFGMPNAGCTEIRYLEGGAWKTL